MASRRMGTLYIGVTNDISRRVWEHKNGVIKGFTSRYKAYMLVWYEYYEDITDAIACEKRMKEWNRAWKVRAIEEVNPSWDDLYETLL